MTTILKTSSSARLLIPLRKKSNKAHFAFCFLILTFFLQCNRGTLLPNLKPTTPAVNVDVEIETDGNQLFANLTYKNNTTNLVYLERGAAGLTGNLSSPLFRISTADGHDVPYVQKSLKIRPPGPEDYVGLEPMKTIKARLRIDQAYSFELGSKIYKLAIDVWHVHPVYHLMARSVGEVKFKASLDDHEEFKDVYNLVALTKTQESTVARALVEAQNLLQSRLTELNKSTISDDEKKRLKKWFGRDDAVTIDKVKKGVQAILDLSRKTSVNNCKYSPIGPPGSEDAYASVLRSDTTTHTINLYGTFFSAPLTGTDSQAGTLVHEMAHFVDSANLRDEPGTANTSGCISLAVTSPDRNLNAANCMEYYAETP